MKIVKLSKKEQGWGVRGRILAFLKHNRHQAFLANEIAKWVKAPVQSVYSQLWTLRWGKEVRAKWCNTKRRGVGPKTLLYFIHMRQMDKEKLEMKLQKLLAQVHDMYWQALHMP